jgi:hypothetical protein
VEGAQYRGETVFSRVKVRPGTVALVVAFACVAIALLLDIAIRNDPISVDFHTYLAAARVGLQDGWSNVYDQALVAVQQKDLVPDQVAQPFISPPTVALVAAPLAALPYNVAYVVWAFVTFLAFAIALAWAGVSRGWSRWIAVAGALSPWWVMHAVNVGQVVPLVAAGTVLAWRLLRDRREVLAGVALLAILLKPNTASLVPVALLVAMRWRALASWFVGTAVIGAVVLLTIGVDGMSSYVSQLRQPMPSGGDNLTLHGALDVTGGVATALRVVIVGAVLAASFRWRHEPGLVLPLAIVGSLIISPYLHGSDLCVLSAAAWMVWEERAVLSWRLPLAAGWLLASPYMYLRGAGPQLQQWPLLEIALLVAMVLAAWWPLTTRAATRSRAPA